jgi:hypothetical protein
MTLTSTHPATIRSYTRVAGDHEQTVFVTIDPNGYIRMTAENLHHVLHELGFTETTKEQAHG